MTGIRYHAAALLRAVAHRIHPVDTDAFPRVGYATGGAITAPSTDDDSVPAWLSGGQVSDDGGRTWMPSRPIRRPPAGGAGEAKAR